jgi:flagellar biosynthesis protein FlhG
MLLDRKIWAVASGKGGTGKTILAASMAVHLADLGFKVMLVDVDLACANLHTLLGMEWPPMTLADFIERRVENIEDVAVPTEVPNLRLIVGALDPIEAALIRYQQKRRIMRQLNTLAEDVVILDLATGASLTQVELFQAAELGAFVILPEPTAIENAYRLLRMLYFHRIRELPGWKKFERNLPPKLMGNTTPPVEFLEEVDRLNPKWSRAIGRRMETFNPGLVINQARTKEDRELGPAVSLVTKRYFGLDTPFLGAIEYDECVLQAGRHRKPVLLDYPHSRPSRSIRQITENLLSMARRRT